MTKLERIELALAAAMLVAFIAIVYAFV